MCMCMHAFHFVYYSLFAGKSAAELKKQNGDCATSLNNKVQLENGATVFKYILSCYVPLKCKYVFQNKCTWFKMQGKVMQSHASPCSAMLPGNMTRKGSPCVSLITMMIHTLITTTEHTVCVQHALALNKNKDNGTVLQHGWILAWPSGLSAAVVGMALRQLIGFRTNCYYPISWSKQTYPAPVCPAQTTRRRRGKKNLHFLSCHIPGSPTISSGNTVWIFGIVCVWTLLAFSLVTRMRFWQPIPSCPGSSGRTAIFSSGMASTSHALLSY